MEIKNIKHLKMLDKKALKLGQGVPKLTKAEAEVLHLLADEFLTVRQASIRRKCSPQNIYEILTKLKKKGMINRCFKQLEKNQPTLQANSNQIRLHGQEFNINIIYKDQRYKQGLEKCNTINIDGNTIRLYRNSIEVYSGKSFYADDTQKATIKSFEYWNRLFVRLEHDLKIILIKPRSQNIRLVNQHYAETNNELSEECEKKAEKIRIYANDDGKLWFTIDNSFNLHEAETQHPVTAKQDMGNVVKPLFNDLRDKKHYLPSEIRTTVNATLKLVHEVAAAQLNQTKIMESLLPKPIEERELIKERPDYVG